MKIKNPSVISELGFNKVTVAEKIGRDISPEKLISNMIVAGAARVDTTTMTPNAFVEMADDQVAQCTGVTVNYQGYKAD